MNRATDFPTPLRRRSQAGFAVKGGYDILKHCLSFGPKQTRRSLAESAGREWRLPESNWGHTDFQSVALPTELRRRSGANVANQEPKVKRREGRRGGSEATLTMGSQAESIGF